MFYTLYFNYIFFIKLTFIDRFTYFHFMAQGKDDMFGDKKTQRIVHDKAYILPKF